jgi:hypothetical protein
MSLYECYKEELQRLKPPSFCCIYVAVETATHKDSRVVTQTLKPRPSLIPAFLFAISCI